MKKFLLSVFIFISVAVGAFYYETYNSYQKYSKLTPEQQQTEAMTSPIHYMVMKKALFWIDTL